METRDYIINIPLIEKVSNEQCAIAQELNKYFVSIASNINKSIDDLGVINITPLQSFQEFMLNFRNYKLLMNSKMENQVTYL